MELKVFNVTRTIPCWYIWVAFVFSAYYAIRDVFENIPDERFSGFAKIIVGSLQHCVGDGKLSLPATR